MQGTLQGLKSNRNRYGVTFCDREKRKTRKSKLQRRNEVIVAIPLPLYQPTSISHCF